MPVKGLRFYNFNGNLSERRCDIRYLLVASPQNAFSLVVRSLPL